MSITPFFSVLIAQYNNAKYLQEAIDSVKNQTHTNWEIIIVDDASTDNSIELYKLYEDDKRIKIYYNQENKGCGYTKKRCAELATGEICGFLDPDDVLLPDALQLMVNLHKNHLDVSIIHSRCYVCDAKLTILYEYPLLELKEDEDYFSHRMHGACHFSSYKNIYYKKTEGISPLYLAGVDQDLYFKLEEVGKVHVFNGFTYKWRTGLSTSITSNKDKTCLWNLIARYETCLRRGYDVNEYLLPDYKIYLDMARVQSFNEGVASIRNSKSYCLGRFILKPFRLIIKSLKKTINMRRATH